MYHFDMHWQDLFGFQNLIMVFKFPDSQANRPSFWNLSFDVTNCWHSHPCYTHTDHHSGGPWSNHQQQWQRWTQATIWPSGQQLSTAHHNHPTVSGEKSAAELVYWDVYKEFGTEETNGDIWPVGIRYHKVRMLCLIQHSRPYCNIYWRAGHKTYRMRCLPTKSSAQQKQAETFDQRRLDSYSLRIQQLCDTFSTDAKRWLFVITHASVCLFWKSLNEM